MSDLDQERTPVFKETGFELVLKELNKLHLAVRDVANDVLELRSVERRVGHLEAWRIKHEVTTNIVPSVLSCIAILTSIWALARGH